eukprot:4394408-Karenia_brevis.AAC.1
MAIGMKALPHNLLTMHYARHANVLIAFPWTSPAQLDVWGLAVMLFQCLRSAGRAPAIRAFA